jgi:hypothetical protein
MMVDWGFVNSKFKFEFENPIIYQSPQLFRQEPIARHRISPRLWYRPSSLIAMKYEDSTVFDDKFSSVITKAENPQQLFLSRQF